MLERLEAHGVVQRNYGSFQRLSHLFAEGLNACHAAREVSAGADGVGGLEVAVVVELLVPEQREGVMPAALCGRCLEFLDLRSRRSSAGDATAFAAARPADSASSAAANAAATLGRTRGEGKRRE